MSKEYKSLLERLMAFKLPLDDRVTHPKLMKWDEDVRNDGGLTQQERRMLAGSVANFSGGRDRFEKLRLFMPLTNRTPAPDAIFLASATDPSGSCASVQCLSASHEPIGTI